MASAVSIYKSGLLLATASAAADSASLGSYTGTEPINGRNITITVTEVGTHAGRSWNTRVISGSGTSTVIVRDPCPFVGA